MYLCSEFKLLTNKENKKMKKIHALMLMVLVALMSVTFQSCKDDDKNDPVTTYTIETILEDKGDMSDEEAALYQEILKDYTIQPTTDLNTAKKAIDTMAEALRKELAEETVKKKNTNKCTFAFILKDPSKKEVYKKSIVVDGTNVTIK